MSSDPTQNIKINVVEEQAKLLEQHKQKMMPLVRFLKKNGLKFKHAGCMGGRVQYFRMDNLAQIMEQKKQQIAKDEKLTSLFTNINNQLIFFKRPQNSEKLRFPQVLTLTGTDSGKFASFKFDTTQSKKIYLYIILALIIAGVLFPLWPYELKYGLWLLSVVLLIVIISLILVRLVLYAALASFGISFWLFPNMFGDYGLVDSFKPLYTITRWQNDVFSVILRVLSFVLFIYYCHSIYIEPQFYIENFSSAKQIVQDVHDWGVNKITGEAGNFSQRALTMQKILNETADAFEQQKKQYTSFEVPDQQTNDDDKADQTQIESNQIHQIHETDQQEQQQI